MFMSNKYNIAYVLGHKITLAMCYTAFITPSNRITSSHELFCGVCVCGFDGIFGG